MDSRESPEVDADDVDAEQERTGPRKRIIFGILGTIAVIAILFFGVKWFLYARVHESTDDARIDATVVQINSKISERVDSILVDTDAAVKKGQTLVVLDSADERARLAQAKANYDLALANQRTLTQQGQGGVAQAQAGVAGSESAAQAVSGQVTTAHATVPSAQAAYAQAQANLQRTQSLVSTGDVPRAQLDAARAASASALAQLQSAQVQIGSSGSNLSAAQSQIDAQQGLLETAQGKLAQASDPSQVEAAKAAYDQALQTLSYTKIVSPIDGFVGEKSVDIGQTVGTGMTLLTVIPNNVFVTANFKETQLGDVRPGEEVDLSVDAYKGVTFTGRVDSINPASQNTYALVPAQNATGNFVKVTQRIPVKIVFDNYDAARYPMRPGMSVEASVKVR
ncbi:MAG TPA: HlyD family secretion protein [Verrucomicrobiae bacterium]|jgi:membrane fusion protein (multidrug efflux system)|nr:HlyD family secretion protein [Verrucomicrobiae bacterium]